MNDSQTIAAILTPPGRGALATIVIRGPRAREIAENCLDRRVEKNSARPWLRRFQSVAGAAEELVVSFPTANEARLHCHGGPAACEAILQSLESQGARRVSWRDIANPARTALANALTERAALVLLDQLQGAWNAELTAIIDLLENPAAWQLAAERIETLLSRGPLGLHLTNPWKVIIAGRPNAGKSSLLNALLGYQRAITSPLPGTTRDIVTARTALDGWPVELRDTAGLRETSDPLESTGVERAQGEILAADLVVYLIPANGSPRTIEAELAEIGSWPGRLLIIGSKADLEIESISSSIPLSVSAANGTGLETLIAAIVAQLIGVPPAPGAAVPWLPAQVQTLREVLQLISHKPEAPAKERGQNSFAGASGSFAREQLSLALLPADN